MGVPDFHSYNLCTYCVMSHFSYSFETEPTYSSITIQKNKCPEYGVITVSDRGRLGNLMSQYATLYAYSKLLNRQPVISQHMSDTLLKVFPSASIPSSSICKLKIQHCTVQTLF